MQKKRQSFHNPGFRRNRSSSRVSGKSGQVSFQGNRSTLRTLDGAYSLLLSRAQEKQQEVKQLDPYSSLKPPNETVTRRIFLWSNRKKNFTLKEFQQIDSILTPKEIRDVFEALRPYASKVLNGKRCRPCNLVT